MKKEYIKLSINDLVPNERNPRKNADAVDAVAKSISETDYITPIVIDEDNKVLAGHTRLLALKRLSEQTGNKIIEVLKVSGLTEEQKKKYSIYDNKTGEIAEWDFEILQEDFEIDELLEFGFDIKDLDQGEVIEDEAPPVPEISKTVKGDLYELGNHRLLCGDSTLINDVERLLDGQKMSLVVTDPPYNVSVNDESQESLKTRNRRSDGLKIANDKMNVDDFKKFLNDIFKNYYIAMLDGASIYVFYADSMTIEFMTSFKDAGFHFAQNCIWNKHQFVMTRKDYHYKHEPVMYGWKDGASHSWMADRKQSSVWNFDRPFKNTLHPTMKPIELLRYPIINSSSVGSNVLDLFLGSGSTLIACEQTNRKCYGMELDEKYCDVIVQRYVNFTKNTKIKLNGKEIDWKITESKIKE